MVRNLNYTYVSPDMLTDSERWTIFGFRKGVAFMQDNFPDELEQFLGEYATNVDVSNISINQAAALLVQKMQDDYEQDGHLETTKQNLITAIPEEAISNAYHASYGTMAADFSGSGWSSAAGESNPNNCDLGECSIHIYNPFATCYEWCQNQEGNYDPNDFSGEVTQDNEQGFSFGNFFGGLLDGVGDIAEEIGWDNIWGTLTNTNDNGQSDDAPDVNITIEGDEPTNWGRIALMAGITIAVGVGLYFLLRKKN